MKRLTKYQKREKAVVDLINEMFKIAGHQVTYDDIKDRKDEWFTAWTMTRMQYDEWMEWGRKYLIKNLKMTAFAARREMSWVGLQWGLKFSQEEEDI